MANPNGHQAGTCFFGGPKSTGPINGLQAEYARVPFAHTEPVKLPEDMSDDDAIVISDVFPTSWVSTSQQLAPRSADWADAFNEFFLRPQGRSRRRAGSYGGRFGSRFGRTGEFGPPGEPTISKLAATASYHTVRSSATVGHPRPRNE